MATQTLFVSAPKKTGQWAIETDGLMCVVSGAGFIFGNEVISRFLGIALPWLTISLGIVALVYGLFLLYRVATGAVTRNLLQLAIILDVVWVIATIVLLAAAPNALTTEGRWTMLIAGDVVTALGIWQYVGLRRLAR